MDHRIIKIYYSKYCCICWYRVTFKIFIKGL